MKYIDLRKESPYLDATYSEYPVSYYFMDMTLEEIAAADGTSVQAVQYSIQAGKKNLKKILERLFQET